MELRDKIAKTLEESTNLGWSQVADAILALPEIDPTPTRMRVLAALGGLRDDMTPEQVKTIQQFAGKLP